MTETSASLRRQLASAGDLRSVVRTMKALAAASIGQYERSVRALGDYHRAVELGLGVCFRRLEPVTITNPAVGHRADATTGVVVFGSDQGLVGRFNEVIAEDALEVIASIQSSGPPPRVWAVGGRVHGRLAEAGLTLMPPLEVPSSVEGIAPLVARILVETEVPGRGDELDELHLLHNRAGVAPSYGPVRQRLLPLDEPWRRELARRPWPTKRLPEVLGSEASTLRVLIREYVFISLFRACAESLASENASRLAAMQRADKNIDELMEALESTVHRVRQAAIDEELFDVIAGFEALTTASDVGAGRR